MEAAATSLLGRALAGYRTCTTARYRGHTVYVYVYMGMDVGVHMCMDMDMAGTIGRAGKRARNVGSCHVR